MSIVGICGNTIYLVFAHSSQVIGRSVLGDWAVDQSTGIASTKSESVSELELATGADCGYSHVRVCWVYLVDPHV